MHIKNLSGRIDDLLRRYKLPWRLDRGTRQLGRLQGRFYRNVNSQVSTGRSFIFCTSYINDIPRYRRWIDYIQPRCTAFGVGHVVLINDGEDNVDFDNRLHIVDTSQPLPDQLQAKLLMFTFPKRLGRYSPFNYPGWWRSFTFSVRIARKYDFDKIIHIESDAFVCSHRLADYIHNTNRGWTALWSNSYTMPETAIQVICKDAFADLEHFADRGNQFFHESNTLAEYLLPFTKIEHRFKGDRAYPLGPRRSIDAFDYLAQVRPNWAFQSDF